MNTEHAVSQPRIEYWRVYVDENGISRQRRCTLTDFERHSMGGAAPQWNLTLDGAPAKALFCVLPVDWQGDWHENPAPQWIVPLSGRWFVETMDGTRIEMGAGEVSFGGDQGCVTDANGRSGHRSGTLGDQPAVLMLVQMQR